MQKLLITSAVDPIFNIIEKYGVPLIPERPQGLETLVLLILEQQVSIDSAKATFFFKGKDKNLTYCTLDLSDQNLGVLA
jgi:DNA-3-methyladenine glycosylase II